MGFDLHSAGVRGSDRRELVRLSINYVQSEGSKLRISFAEQLIRDIGWSIGQRIGIGIGNGSDAGLIRLQMSPSGYVLMKPSRGSRPLIWCMVPKGDWPERWAAVVPECRPDTIRKTLTIVLPWEQSRAA